MKKEESHFSPPPYLSWFIGRFGRAPLDLASSGRPERSWDELEPLLRGKPLYEPGFGAAPRMFSEVFSARYELDGTFELIPLPGAGMANYLAVNALVPPGGTVAVESPVYDPVPFAVSGSARRVVKVPRSAGNNWEPDLDALEEALRGGARLFFLTNMHNPSGAFLPRPVLERMDALLARYEAWGLVDEIYLEFRPTWRNETVLAFTERFLVSSSLTKVYGLGNLRAGWLAGPAEAVRRCGEYWTLAGCVSPAPALLVAVHLAPFLEDMWREDAPLLERNAAVFADWVESVGLPRPLEAGSPLRLLALPRGTDDVRAADRAFREFGLFVVPGSFFGAPGHLRIGLFKSTEMLERGLDALQTLLAPDFA